MGTSETSANPHLAAEDRDSTARSGSPYISIVVPAFNEAGRIVDSIRTIEDFLRTLPFSSELVIVDDGSKDETSTVVQGLKFPQLRLVRNPENHGKGHAVRQGVLEAGGEYVLFSDADLSSPIAELQKLLSVARSQNADVVIGSRGLDRKVIERHQSRGRELGGIVFNKMVRLLLGLDIRDTQCGFKLFKRDKILPVLKKMTIPGFGFDPELLFLAARAQLKIVEVPVRWSHAEGSKIRFMRDGTRMFGDLLRIRWNSLVGRYS
jgi:glycosyltransferase involved in cell wall biosynthesis